jgi:hypothetical protein
MGIWGGVSRSSSSHAMNKRKLTLPVKAQKQKAVQQRSEVQLLSDDLADYPSSK